MGAHVKKFSNLLDHGYFRVLRKAKIISASEGKCSLQLYVDEDHVNQAGNLHGGLSAMLVDTTSAFALFSIYSDHAATANLHLSYLASAKIGDQIVVDSQVIKIGKKLAFIESCIKNVTSGKNVVKGNVTTCLSKT